jgi:hypothetical protein
MRVKIPKESGKIDTVIISYMYSSTANVAVAGAALLQDGADIVVDIGIVQIRHNQGLGPLLHGLRIHTRKGTEGSLGKDREGWEEDGRIGLSISTIGVVIRLLHGLVATSRGIRTAGCSHLPKCIIALDGTLDELGRLRYRLGRIPGLTQGVVVILDGSHRSRSVSWVVTTPSGRSRSCGLDGRQGISDATRHEVQVGWDGPIRRCRGGRGDGRLRGLLLDRTAHAAVSSYQDQLYCAKKRRFLSSWPRRYLHSSMYRCGNLIQL